MAKETYIRLRCTEEFKTKIEKLAKLENRTVSNYVENLLVIETLKLAKMEEVIMENLNNETITKEIIEIVNSNCKFVDNVDLRKYENISIFEDGNIIELERTDITEEEIIKNGEVIDVLMSGVSKVRSFRKDSISGVYVEY